MKTIPTSISVAVSIALSLELIVFAVANVPLTTFAMLSIGAIALTFSAMAIAESMIKEPGLDPTTLPLIFGALVRIRDRLDELQGIPKEAVEAPADQLDEILRSLEDQAAEAGAATQQEE
jgi:hypothetical protein